MGVSASDVKTLRERTGAGMMDCKKALVESNGDLDEAVKFLREKGLAAVEKRAGRATNEGRVSVYIEGDGCKGSKAAIVELSSETDFVAKNADFIALGETIAKRAIEKNISEPNDELNGMVTELAAKIRENMSLKRLKLVCAGAGQYLCSYIHGEGQMGVIVKLAADKAEALKAPQTAQLAHDLAMHIVWANPTAIDESGIDPAFIKENEEIFRTQMAEDESLKGKPEKVLGGILQGKVKKLLKSVCLMDQGFIKDEKISVSQQMQNVGKEVGAKFSIAEYVCFKVGE